MHLNYQIHRHENPNQAVIVFIHGLFGSLSNLGMLARHYQTQYTVVQLDVRNHGLSAHSNQLNYHLMAEDVLETLNALNIEKFSLVGHSMGGKIAMQVANLQPNKIKHLIILDIAPITYVQGEHGEIFKALFAVQEQQPSSRLEAAKLMREYIQEEMVIQFLLKSFQQGQWLFNVNALYENYANILAWNDAAVVSVPSLFLRGENSPYISKSEHLAAIEQQFSQSSIHLIENAGHWLHGEKTAEVLFHMDRFLQQ